MENNFSRGNLYIRSRTLKDKAKKLQMRMVEEQAAAEARSRDMNCSVHERTLAELNARELGNLINCYDEIICSEVNSESDLKALEWFFNDGKLRTDEETGELERMNAERERKRERERKAREHAKRVRLDDKVDRMEERVEFFHTKGYFLIPLWTLVLEALFFWITSALGAFYVDTDFGFLYIPFLIPGAMSYLIFIVVHGIIVDFKIGRLYEKCGKEPPLDLTSAVEAGALCHILFKGKKKK